jgi:hypothetical protein
MGRTHPNLDAHYRAERNPNDTSGNAVNGTWGGTEQYAKGRIGEGFDFNGSSWVDTGSESIGDGLFAAADRRWSVALWSRINGANEGTYLGRASANSTQRSFQILRLGTVSNPAFYLRGEITRFALDHNDGVWRHYSVTWDGQTARFYLNGVYFSNLNVGTASEITGQRVIIGARTNGTGFFLSGQIDDVQIWNRALQPHHIRAIYNGVDPAFIGDVA